MWVARDDDFEDVVACVAMRGGEGEDGDGEGEMFP
jgi:hypothetical protein